MKAAARVTGTLAVRCFHGRGSSGNLHQVILPSSDFTQRQAIALSLRIAPTVVLIRRHASAHNIFSLFHCRNGVAITRCGSGSLAAARALLCTDTTIRAPLSFVTPSGPVEVVPGEGDTLGYRIAPLPYLPADNGRSWQQLIDRKMRDLVLIGGEQDYCLIELHNMHALDQCRINAKRLSLMSRRALIVTARCEDSVHDYALRYFSPQYGQYEDGATGSAHAMVAAYWQGRLAKSCVRGIQRSVTGGEFTVQRAGLAQCVYGEALFLKH